MALRSLLRKVPTLGVKTPPSIGHALDALSPAAGSRLLSHGGPGRRKIHSDPIDRLEIAMKEYEWEKAFSNGFIDETMRLYEQEHQSLMKKFDIAEKACDVVQFVCPVAIVLMMSNNAM